jgi:hypothetical protein
VPAQSQVYLVTDRNQIVLLYLNSTDSSNRRYQAVYSKPITIHRGITNEIEFHFINQNQKNVNLFNQNLMWRLMNDRGDILLASKLLEPVYPATGLMKLILTPSETEYLDAQRGYYSISWQQDSGEKAGYTLDNGQARGVAEIVDSIYPRTVSAQNVKLPTRPAVPVKFKSSIIESTGSPITTFQIWASNYTGTITVISSDVPSFSRPVPVKDKNYQLTDFSGSMAIVVDGHYNYLRLDFDNQGTHSNSANIGDITEILVK